MFSAFRCPIDPLLPVTLLTLSLSLSESRWMLPRNDHLHFGHTCRWTCQRSCRRASVNATCAPRRTPLSWHASRESRVHEKSTRDNALTFFYAVRERGREVATIVFAVDGNAVLFNRARINNWQQAHVDFRTAASASRAGATPARPCVPSRLSGPRSCVKLRPRLAGQVGCSAALANRL